MTGTSARVCDWLAVGAGRLQVRTGKVDIGQRISTALAGIVHDELTLPLAQIEVLAVRTGDSPDEGMTSGSNSVEQSGQAVRRAAATLRGLVLAAAAARMGGTPGEWRLEDGALRGPGSNRPLPFLELACGVDLEVPVTAEAALPPRTGPPPALPMRGIGDLVTGRYRFVHDMELPGMLHARVVRPPHPHARLAGIAPGAVDRLAAEGLEVVRDGSFLAVAGPREWSVVKAAARLGRACRWDMGAGLPEDDIFARLTRDNAQRLVVENGTPRPGAPIPPPPADPDHAARYERPYTMHGALAPSAALARREAGRLEVFTHSQGIYPLRDSIAESLDLAPERVVLTHAPGSGCYGHNGADDAAFEAALVAMALPGQPVLLKWSREDEHGWEPFGPPGAVELAAVTGPDGRLSSLSSEAIGGTFRGRPRPGPGRAGPTRLLANGFRAASLAPARATPNLNRQGGLQRNLDPVYDIPRTRQVKNLVTDLPLRSSALRCLGGALNVFAIESFLDEIAHARGRDPIGYRKAQLSDPRAVAVLDRLAGEIAGLPPPGAGTGRGIAFAQYKNAMTRVGIAVDLTVGERGDIGLVRAVLVADAGRVVDRDGLTAQLEGGFLQAASWALHEAVAWDRDGITTRDWDSYPVLRFDNVPEIRVVLLDRPADKSLGAGEAAPGPSLAAIANAVFDATGLRLRRLPFTPEALTAAALTA